MFGMEMIKLHLNLGIYLHSNPAWFLKSNSQVKYKGGTESVHPSFVPSESVLSIVRKKDFTKVVRLKE